MFDLDEGLSTLTDNFKWPVLKILLDVRIIKVATNQALQPGKAIGCSGMDTKRM